MDYCFFPLRVIPVTIFAFAWMFSLTPSAAAQGQTLYMPILQATDEADTGLALSNPTLSEVTVTLTARDYAGAAILGTGITNPATVTLPPSGQRALRAVDIFGAGVSGKTGWVELQSSSLAVKGFFLVFDSRLSFIDGAELQTRPSSRIVFPKVSATAASPTTISFVHTGTEAAPFVALTFYENSGRASARTYLTLAPRSGFSGAITDLLPDVAGLEGYAVLETTRSPFHEVVQTLVGFETYRNTTDVAGLNAVPDSTLARTAYLAHFATRAGFTTRVALVNFTNDSQTIRMTAGSLERNGVALSPGTVSVERTIPANGRLEESADSLFSLTGSSLITGYIQWETLGETRGVIGYLDYSAQQGLLSAVPAQSTRYSDLFFSHIAMGLGYYTGIAFLNANTQATTINVEAFDQNGLRVGSTTVILSSAQRRSNLFSELFPALSTQLGGYVRVTASRPVFAFELFGSSASPSFLANVAAQGVQLEPQASGRVVSAASGANVISADANSSIAILPGALASDTTVSLNRVTTALPPPSSTQRIVASVDAQPSGTTFKIPVRLTFPLAAQLDPGTQLPVLIYTAQGTYEDSGFTAIVDESGRTASAQVTHFTVFATGLSTDRMITVNSISPASGLPGATVTISGSGFSANPSDNIVTFAGAENTSVNATVSAASDTSLTVNVPTGAVTGNVIVRVGTKTSTGVTFNVPAERPKPSLSSVSPSTLPAGTTSADIKVIGTSFHNASVVRVDGTAAATTFVDANTLLATLSGAQVAPGIHKVTVYTVPESGGGGGESGSAELTVGFPVPTITGISPASAEAGKGAVTVTITGTGFTSSSKVLVDSGDGGGTFVNSTTMTVVLFSSVPATRSIVVSNPTPGGGVSGTAVFTFFERPPETPTETTTLEIVSGGGETVAPGIALLNPLKVRLKNLSGGTAVPNATVTWAVAGGGGKVGSSTTTTTSTTNSSGEATITATVGSSTGTNTFTATVGTNSVTFTATSKTLTSSPTSVDVKISSGSVGVGSFQVTINYDATKVQVSASNVVVGNGSGYQLTAVNPDNTAGTLVVNGFSTAAPSGNYTVANVTFTPIRPGSVTLSTSDVTVTDINGDNVSASFLSLSGTSLTVN